MRVLRVFEDGLVATFRRELIIQVYIWLHRVELAALEL